MALNAGRLKGAHDVIGIAWNHVLCNVDAHTREVCSQLQCVLWGEDRGCVWGVYYGVYYGVWGVIWNMGYDVHYGVCTMGCVLWGEDRATNWKC